MLCLWVEQKSPLRFIWTLEELAQGMLCEVLDGV